MGVAYAVAAQNRRGLVHRMAFGKSAQVDAGARMGEAHGLCQQVQLHMAVAHRRLGRCQFGGTGAQAQTVVIEPAHSSVADVKSALGDFCKALGAGQQLQHFRAQNHRACGGFAVDAGEFGGGFVRAHRMVYAVHLGHHG